MEIIFGLIGPKIMGGIFAAIALIAGFFTLKRSYKKQGKEEERAKWKEAQFKEQDDINALTDKVNRKSRPTPTVNELRNNPRAKKR